VADNIADIVESPEPKRLATGFGFTEGPLWHPDGYLLFVDVSRNLILRLVPGDEPEVVRENSAGSNGLTFDLKGRLVMCEGDNRRITRMEEDGAITPIAERWEGNRLNEVNDIVGRSDGSLYFTNPAGGLEPSDMEVDFTGVHRIAPDGTVTAEVREFEDPNGLAFSPDESVLYVSNTRDWMHIKAFDVTPDGSLSNERIFADMGIDVPEKPGDRPPGVRGSLTGVPDGLKVDVEGRVYCTGLGGHWVFDLDGNHLGVIRLPELPANCAWGGPDNRTMFITARTSVYSIRMKTPGTAVPRAM
jgi:gluconolactonase